MNMIISDKATDYFSKKCLIEEAEKIEGIYRAIYFRQRKRAISEIAGEVDGFAKAFIENLRGTLFCLRFCNNDCDFLISFPWACVCRKQKLTLSERVSISMEEGSDLEVCGIIANNFIDVFWDEFCKLPIRGESISPIPSEIFYLERNGKKEIPRWYINDGAFLTRHNFRCDSFLSWLAAERWFIEQGFQFHS